jgi:hypothetical protein
MDIVALTFLVIVPMFFIGPIAEARGRSTRGWLWLTALLLGPIAVIILWLLPPLKQEGHFAPRP